MPTTGIDLLAPRILVVDDERQIHASLRLRLGKDYGLVCHTDPRQALALLADERFDLCIVDIHMPHMDGLTFVEAAQHSDPGLGFIILSVFDSDDNLRRTIPLQVYDFVSKPLPDREGFERRIPHWIEKTRQCRRQRELAEEAGTIATDRDSARLEREVELVASETARDALLQTASLLTTIHAHLVTATTFVGERAKLVSGFNPLMRNLEEARRTADAAMSIAEDFFESAYGNRDSSPALVGAGVAHAISIATRMCHAAEANKLVDFSGADDHVPIRGLSGIDFLLMVVPAVSAALTAAGTNSTVRIDLDYVARLENAPKDPRFRQHLWLNRRNALNSHPGVCLTISATCAPLSRVQFEAWLKGEYTPFARVTPRGLIAGVQKCHGLLATATAPESVQFRLALALPT